MSQLKLSLIAIGILTGATVGAGVFALPFAFSLVGVGLGSAYLVVLSLVVLFAHVLYYRVLEREDGRLGLLGLVREHFGKRLERLGFLGVVIGLILTLTAYIVLSANFILALFPDLTAHAAYTIAWAVLAVPMLFRLRRLIGSELVGTALMVVLVFVVFWFTPRVHALDSYRLLSLTDVIFPFGPVLFAIAGWTAIEPIYAWRKRHASTPFRIAPVLALGTALCVLLYFLFTFGILKSAATVTADTVTGLAGWPPLSLIFLMLFGFFAVWTSYLPMSTEVRQALRGDLRWPGSLATVAVFFLPYLFVLAGLNSFLTIVAIVGGILLALQYLLILLVARRVLTPRGSRLLAIDVSIIVFSLAIIYELYYVFLAR